MTPQEVGDLLRFCASVDQWLKATSPEEGAVMVAGWSAILEHVPLELAMRTARTHYREPNARTIQPGDLVGAWNEQRDTEAKTEAAEATRALAAAAEAIPVGGASTYLRDMQAAIARGEDPASVPRPAGVRVISPAANERSRRCTYWQLCACTHLECRDGWLDDETTVLNSLDRAYQAVQRCTNCRDALLMAEERGIAKKPSRTHTRPR